MKRLALCHSRSCASCRATQVGCLSLQRQGIVRDGKKIQAVTEKSKKIRCKEILGLDMPPDPRTPACCAQALIRMSETSQGAETRMVATCYPDSDALRSNCWSHLRRNLDRVNHRGCLFVAVPDQNVCWSCTADQASGNIDESPLLTQSIVELMCDGPASRIASPLRCRLRPGSPGRRQRTASQCSPSGRCLALGW
jgi:hypothetical protein